LEPKLKSLLFTYDGRITRAKVWLALLYYLLVGLAVGVVMWILWQIIPGSVGDDGSFHIEGAAAVPYALLTFAAIGFFIWSGICVGVKRYHDRNKSGWWLLIQFVPLIGSIWYFVDVFCLRGTVGDNSFGPDPLAAV
jgi:uncharacterized membrane protein YhaH (DUF805 family)